VDKVQFGELIRTLRMAQNMEAQQLAHLVGVSPVAIYYVESGRNQPRLVNVARMEAALNLPHGTLLRQTPQYAMLKDVLEGEPDNG
jgi:transcriptional regulator with XRE-family HTH domain